MPPAAANAYEKEREERIAANRKKMEELGLMKASSILDNFRSVKQAPAARPKADYVKQARAKAAERAIARLDPRRSTRLSGTEVTSVEIDERDRPVPSRAQQLDSSSSRPTEAAMLDDPEALVDLMENARHVSVPENASQEVWEAMQAVRCNSKGRGTLYDKTIGITCHFCRQKKLCGEENCPRCSARDASKECIGKSNCTRCGSATGMFCRSCLELRYGQDLDQAKAQERAGEWLCPHCYEDDHPDDGWICNSSICMTRRGLKPTGIAIYDARKLGFKSVAHLLQDRIRKRKGGVNGSQDEEEGSDDGSDAKGDSQALNNHAAEAPKPPRGGKKSNNKAAAALDSEEEEDDEGATLGSRLRKMRAAATTKPAQQGDGKKKEEEEGDAKTAAGARAQKRGRAEAVAAEDAAAAGQEAQSPAQPTKRRSARLVA